MVAQFTRRPTTSQGGTFAAPPSYDMAISSASLQTSPDEKRYRGFSKKDQLRCEQELYDIGRQRGELSRSFAPPPTPFPFASPADAPSTRSSIPFDPITALARFGSPFATCPDWSPSRFDASLTRLPTLNLDLRIKMCLSSSSNEKQTPPGFNRPYRPSHSLAPFEPLLIRSANDKKAKKQLLTDGFKSVYFGRLMVQHDVSAADWGRFLDDLASAGKLTGKQNIISNIAPVTMHMGITGYFVTKAIQKGMKKRKQPAISEMVETWQQNFFSARNLDVYVLFDGERITARSPNAPIPATDLPVARRLRRSSTSSSRSSSSSSSSSDSDSEDDLPMFGPDRQKLDKHRRRMLRKQRKAERKQRRAEMKHERKMARMEKKRRRKYEATPDLPQRASSSSASSLQSTSQSGQGGVRGGFILVIAPLLGCATDRFNAEAAVFE